MLIVLSPAKRLDYKSELKVKDFSKPNYLSTTKKLVEEMKKKSPKDLMKLMKISDKIAQENFERYQGFKTPLTLENSRQAIFAFQGDVYLGLKAQELGKKDLNFAQKHLRILSGLYGMLCPLDLVYPYRLEMGTKSKFLGKKDLPEVWKETLTKDLNKTLKENKDKYLINLASKEYFNALDTTKIEVPIITPIFKDSKKGTDKPYKIMSMFAKKARGMMARFIVQNRPKKLEDLQKFNEEGYKFSVKESTDTELVFLRKY